jgi:hypothetical protein
VATHAKRGDCHDHFQKASLSEKLIVVDHYLTGEGFSGRLRQGK